MAAMLRSVRKAKHQVEKILEEVRAKPLAEPLGGALLARPATIFELTMILVISKIVDGLASIVAGGSVVGGALAFGASLFNTQPLI